MSDRAKHQAQHQTVRNPAAPEPSTITSDRMREATGAVDPHALQRPGAPQRRRALLVLQQTHGNAAAQRLLARSRHPAGPIQRQWVGLEDMPEGLRFARRVEDLFDLYATRNQTHQLPGTIFAYTRAWIEGSAGAGRIREEVRRRLRTLLDPAAGLIPWVEAMTNRARLEEYVEGISGPAARKRELSHIIGDLFEAPTWRATNQIQINPRWPAWRRRYAAFWNEKGQLCAQLGQALNPALDQYVAAGVMAAETRQEFFRAGRAIARFELHVFWREWGNTSPARRQLFRRHFRFNQQGPHSQGHRWRRDPNGAFQSFHGNQNREWEALDFARTLDGAANEAAVESTSFGAGQTMGFNFRRAGFASPLEMLEHYQTRERAQIEGVINYIATITPAARRTNVINEANDGNFLPLSRAYGPANPQHHAQRIAGAVGAIRQMAQAAANPPAAPAPAP